MNCHFKIQLTFVSTLKFTYSFFIPCAYGKSGDAALFERVSQSVKVKKYSEALNDLNAAIEADPSLSEAYWRRASILRQLCRFPLVAIMKF